MSVVAGQSPPQGLGPHGESYGFGHERFFDNQQFNDIYFFTFFLVFHRLLIQHMYSRPPSPLQQWLGLVLLPSPAYRINSTSSQKLLLPPLRVSLSLMTSIWISLYVMVGLLEVKSFLKSDQSLLECLLTLVWSSLSNASSLAADL